MPDVTYSPTQGRVSRVSAEEDLAGRMQDFVLRKALANQQAGLARESLAQQASLAREGMGLQERMQGNQLGAEREIQGTFGDRSAAQMGLADKQIGGQKDIANIGAKSALSVAREANAPQIGALGLAQRQYDDSRGDTAGKRALENMKANIALQALGGSPADAGAGGGRPSMTSEPPQSASSTERMRREMDAGIDTGSALAQLGSPAVPAQRRPGMMDTGAPGSYQVDQNTMDSMKSMRDQLAAQGKDVSRLDMLAKADSDLLMKKGAAEPQRAMGKPDQSAIQRVIDGTVRAEAPKGMDFMANLDAMSPTQRKLIGSLLGADLSDPIQQAEQAKKISDIQAGPIGAIQNRQAQIGAQQGLSAAVLGTPAIRQQAADLKRIAPTGNTEQFIAKMQEIVQSMVSSGVPEAEATATVRAMAQDAVPSAAVDRLSQGMSMIPGVGLWKHFLSPGGAFPDRSGIRQATGLE